jgi:hypothetical protein
MIVPETHQGLEGCTESQLAMAGWKRAGDGRDKLARVAGVYSTSPRWKKIPVPLTLEGSTLARRRECTRDAHLTHTWEVRLKLMLSVLLTRTSATESELGHKGVSLAERTDMRHTGDRT